MSEWKSVTLSDAAEIISGYAFKGEHFSDNGDSTVVKIKDIKPPIVDIESATKVFMSHYSVQKLEKYKIGEGDFILAMTGATIGKVGRVAGDYEAYINQRVAKINPREGVNKNFIYYCLNEGDFDYFIQNNIDSHSAQENISAISIGRYPIELPTRQEQDVIAEILSSLDDKIDLLHRQNKTLETLAETLFRQWFIEESATVSTRQILLGDLIKSISDTHALLSPDIIFLNTSDVYLGNVLKDDRESVHSLPGQAKKSIKNGDILFSEIRPANGRYAYIDFDAEDYVVSTKLMVLRSKGILSQAFVYFFLTNSKTLEWLQTLAEARSGTFPQITFDQLRDLVINVPSEEDLVSASLLCDDWLKKIKFNQSQIKILRNIRDVILPKLMSGEIRVQFNLSKDSEAA